MSESTSTPPYVEARGIWKSFGGAQALAGVTVGFQRGEVHALVGENGAGKSTLGRLIAGVVTSPDRGEIAIDGSPVRFHGPRDALRHGITIIAQELALLPLHSVLENIYTGGGGEGRGRFRRRELLARFAALNDSTGFGLKADANVGSLRVAEQQKVEIMRALARRARLIVMDEPTAALTRDESLRLLEIVRGLRDTGTTVVYVSHALEDVLSIADRVTVLKDGQLVRTGPAAQETHESLVTAMLGRSLEVSFPPRRRPPADAPVVLAARGLSRPPDVEHVDLSIRAGEILGIVGLVGSGRSEVAHILFGADPDRRAHVELDGRRVTIGSPRAAIDAGIVLLPESRKDQGLLMGRTVAENLLTPRLSDVAWGPFLRRRAERKAVAELIESVDIRPPRPSTIVQTLSGGNQQKVLFGKWLACRPRVFIADEPTRGVDVGAKRAIHELIVALADSGVAVLLISSELEEVRGLAHRLLVMRRGRVVGEFEGEASEEVLMTAAFAGRDGHENAALDGQS